MSSQMTKDDMEKDAALRAALAERYEKEQQKDTNENQDKDTDQSKILTRDSYMNITDIETDVNEDYTSLIDLRESVKDVNKVRFKLENCEYTVWYKWEPDNTNYQLTRAVDHYANGDIADLIRSEVSVADINGSYFINFPAPYNSRIGHLSYPIYQKLRLFNNPNDNEYTVVTAVNNRKEPVEPDNDLSIYLSKKSAYNIGTLHMIAVIACSAYGFMSSMILLSIIPMILAILVYTQIDSNSSFSDGFATGVPKLMITTMITIKKMISKTIKSIDRYDPIE